MNRHAGVFVAGSDRERLARICRYTARPVVAVDRLQEPADGRFAYTLRHGWHDGTTHVVFEPKELLARLAAQIPPLRAHQLRYHGIFAPAAAYRDKIVARNIALATTIRSQYPQSHARLGSYCCGEHLPSMRWHARGAAGACGRSASSPMHVTSTRR
jgi:hypothetical protein